MDALPANLRNMGIVFQNRALFPHMSVAGNIAYGLEAHGRPRDAVRRTVDRFLDVVRLRELRDRLPRQLSGGQQQRVAPARALAVEPTMLLLDAPFSAIDKSLRLDMQIEIKRLQRPFGFTAILVTHDQDEAITVADRIAVMDQGRVEQFDTPVNVYDRPATLFVSGFIGTANLLAGKSVESGRGTTVVKLDAGARLTVTGDRTFTPGSRVVVIARPEQLDRQREPAAATMVIATILGTLASVAIARQSGKWVRVLDTFFMSPIILPMLAFGLAVLMYFTFLGLHPSLKLIMIGHVIVVIPFVLRTTSASMSQLDSALLESSASLGASAFYTFRRVTLPIIAPGIVAAGFLAFVASLDNVPVSLFLAGPRSDMLPIRMWGMMESTLDVRVAAVSAVLIASELILMLVIERLVGLTRRLRD